MSFIPQTSNRLIRSLPLRPLVMEVMNQYTYVRVYIIRVKTPRVPHSEKYVFVYIASFFLG